MAERRSQRRRKVKIQRRIGAASDTGPVRQANEDAYFIPGPGVDTRLGVLFIVADGVGGQKHGRDAADLAVQTIPTTFYQMRQNGSNLADSLNYALVQANEIIFGEAQRRGAGRMGCTVVAAAQHQNHLLIAHAGDARAYLAQKGKLKLLTRDHSWVQEQVEAGALTAEEAAAHELRNVVTRVLGNEPNVEVELSGPFQVDPGDAMLLCSDGLYDVVSQKEIYKTLTGASPRQAAGRLVRSAVQAGAHDNVTAVVAALGREGVYSLNTLITYPLPGGVPLFLPIVLSILIIALGSLLIIGSMDRPGAATAINSNQPNPTDAVPLATILSGGLAPVTATLTITNSAFMTAIGTITATELPGVLLESAPSPSPSGVSTSTVVMLGCVASKAYFWPVELYLNDDEALCKFTEHQWFENDPYAILLTDLNNPESFLGYDVDGSCALADFIKVQSRTELDKIGWVNLVNVKPLNSGEEICP